MTFPLLDNGAVAGLLLGLLFGFALEGAGFGSARKLTAQFTLRDFTVFKVMFTAVIVAAVGLWLSDVTGLMPAGRVFVPTLYFWAIGLGGALIGAGFALGGYCPGTSVAALASGRGDALAFMAGMVAGVWVFAAGFDEIFDFYAAAKGPQGETLDQLLGLPTPVILGVLVLAAVAGFIGGSRLEKRFGGPLTVEDTQGAAAAAEPKAPRGALPASH